MSAKTIAVYPLLSEGVHSHWAFCEPIVILLLIL